MSIAVQTAAICFLGWASHWFASWGEQWKTKHQSLMDFINDNPPAFWFSITTTVAVYLIGPSVLPAVGVVLPAQLDQVGVKLITAFAAGYMADSLVYKVANLTRKS